MASRSTVDAALIDLFRAELDTHIPALSEGLLALEKQPNQPERFEALMRAAHSLKGAARIVGVDRAVRVAHALEDCFVAAQTGEVRLDSDAIDVLLQGVDTLHRVALDIEGAEPDDAAVETLLSQVAAIRAGRTPVRPRPVALPAPPPTLRVNGMLDVLQAETLRLQVLDLAATNPGPLRLDLTEVTDVDPAGLVLLARLAQSSELSLEVKPSPVVSQLVRLARLDALVGGTGA